ncbi:Cytochrome P450 - like 10 [Theobroma cacao]|nr:Cytochrome P450 - like 10 [Theobroma cacao]
MDTLAYIVLFIFAVFFFFALNRSKSSSGLPGNNRLFLVILSLLFPSLDLQLHDKIAEVLERSKRTVHIDQYSWITGGTKILVTSDPANVRHILSTNFSRYPKGLKWREKIDILGDTLFSVDLEEWEQERKLVRGFTGHQKFHQVMTNIIWERAEKGLIPVLERVSERGLAVDLQDLFRKHILDIAWMMVIGYNPNSLSIEFREDQFSKALEDACEASFSRYLMPESLWKLQRWLGIGKEKKLKDAWKTIDRVFAECISKKQEESTKGSFNFEGFYYSTGHDDQAFGSAPTRKGLRDNVISLIFATQDTTSSVLTWFFWMVSKHPSVEAKIRDEIAKVSQENQDARSSKSEIPFKPQELNELVYLHAALCETLRLFPPGPVLSRTALQPDTLPSGHGVDQNTIILIAVHAMGRMTSVWGEDCHEFKPERWLTEGGDRQIKHVPHYQFVAFSAGPRICLGKELAFTMMKATAATIIHNYKIQIPRDYPVKPVNSVIFHMKHGLKARIKNRWT